MSHPIPGHDYSEQYKGESKKEYSSRRKKAMSIAKKMSPAGKLSAMVKDKPVTLQDHLDWFRKHKS